MKITKLGTNKYYIDYRVGNERFRYTEKCDAETIKKIKSGIEYKIIAHKLGLPDEVKKTPKEKTLIPEFLKEKSKENLRKSHLDRLKYSLSLIGPSVKTKLNKFSPATFNSYLNDINIFYNWAKEKGYNYKFKIKKKKLDKPLPKFFNHSELEIIFKESKGIYKDIYNVLLQSGIRISELYICNYDEGYITIPAEYSKSRRDRHIPVSTDIEEILERVQANQLHTRTIQKNLRKIIDKHKMGNKKSCHSFRHTFALYTILNNDVTYVQCLLGHSDVKTTMVYLSFDKEFIKKNLKIFVHPLSKNVSKESRKEAGDIAQLGERLNGIQEVSPQ